MRMSVQKVEVNLVKYGMHLLVFKSLIWVYVWVKEKQRKRKGGKNEQLKREKGKECFDFPFFDQVGLIQLVCKTF